MWNTIVTDFQIIFEREAAVRNWLEVLLCYLGWHALVFHRIAHRIQQIKIPFLPSLISNFARLFTGEDEITKIRHVIKVYEPLTPSIYLSDYLSERTNNDMHIHIQDLERHNSIDSSNYLIQEFLDGAGI